MGLNEDLFTKVNTAKDLLECEDFTSEQAWLVDEILPKGVGGLVIGSEKSFKSSVTMDLAQAVANGEPFAGKKTTKSRVLIIQNENSRMTEHQRLAGTHRNVSDDLFFLHGGAFKLDQYAYNERGEQYNIGLRQLYHFILKEDISLVILDPLKDLLTDDETLNSNQTMNRVLRGITDLKLTLDTKNDKLVSFLIVAHARKQVGEQSIDEKHFRVKPSQVLGATAIPAWYEVCFTMSPKVSKKTGNAYSIMKVYARNFAYNNEVTFGYVADEFISFDPNKKNKPLPIALEEDRTGEEMTEITKEEGEEFLNDLKDAGKVTEIEY